MIDHFVLFHKDNTVIIQINYASALSFLRRKHIPPIAELVDQVADGSHENSLTWWITLKHILFSYFSFCLIHNKSVTVLPIEMV